MLPDDVVTIDCDERNISKIKSGETEYSLIGTSADDYPELPSVNKYTSITLELGTIKDMIKKTIFSVSTSERNPVHTGVKFEISDNKIVLVAVDGARLAIRREIVRDGYFCVEVEPFEFSKNRTKGIIDTVIMGLSLLNQEYPEYVKIN
jgi:DNA polymerase-3 subunit beta